MSKQMKCPKCSKCGKKMKPIITTFADRYEPMAIYDDPRAGYPYFTGEYHCPDCDGV